MDIQELVETIQNQQQEINRLNQIISENSFERKYKKALKDISGVMKANKQLKQELDQLCIARSNNLSHQMQLQIEQYRQAYEKILEEKNKLKKLRQNDQAELQQLRYSNERLEQYISELKSEKMTLLREKQTLQKFYQKEQGQRKNTQNAKSSTSENRIHHEKEVRLTKKIETYEQRVAHLVNQNSQLQQRIKLLKRELIQKDNQIQLQINKKDLEIERTHLQVKKEFESVIEKLKKTNSQLNSKINSLEIKLQTEQFKAVTTYQQNQPQYQSQFIETLRQLKVQMEPMKSQISQLVKFDQNQRDEVLREKNSLKMRVLQLQAQLKTNNQNSKMLENRINEINRKNKNYEEQNKAFKKLEEENRLLRGKIIVHQSKDIALKNRSSQELQDRVIEFQTRVQLLLSDRETLSKIKNVSIHQLIALKAYIMELDTKLKSLIGENQYMAKKYKSYKEKYLGIFKEIKKHDTIVTAYKAKIQGYDKLVMKLQQQLDRTLNLYSRQVEISKFKSNQYDSVSIQVYQKQLSIIKQKLEMQERYSKQQIETIKLNYETKIMEANLKIEKINNLEDTIQLYKNKNQQLQIKLEKKEAQIVELSMYNTDLNKEKTPQDETSMMSRYSKDLINSLHIAINQKQNQILRINTQLKNVQQFWKNKYANLQQQCELLKQNSIKASRIQHEDKKIIQLEQQCKRYRIKIAQLEAELLKISTAKSQIYDFNRENGSKVTTLQIQLENANNKIKLLESSKIRLQKRIQQLEQQNIRIQENYRFSKTQKIWQHSNTNQHVTSHPIANTTIKSQPITFNNTNLQQQINELRQQNYRLQMELNSVKFAMTQGSKNHGEVNELRAKNSQLTFKFQSLNIQILNFQKINNNISKNLQQTENRLRQYQILLNKIENEKNASAKELKKKDITIQQLKIELRTKQTLEKEEEINKYRIELDQMQFQKNRQISDKNFEIDSLTSKLDLVTRKLSNTEQLLLTKEKQIRDLNGELLLFRSNSSNQAQILKSKIHNFQDSLRTLEMQLERSQLQSSMHQTTIRQVNDKLDEKQNQILRMKGELRQIGYLRQQLQQLKINTTLKQQQILKLNASLRRFQFQILQQKEILIGSLKSQLASVKNQMTNDMEYWEERVRSLDSECRHLQVNYNGAHQEIFSKNEIISKLQQELFVIQSENRTIKLSNEQIQLDFELKQQQFLSFSNENAKLRQENSALKVDYDRIEMESSTNKRQIIDLKKTIQENFIRIEQISYKINQLIYDNNRQKKYIQELEEEKQSQQNMLTRQNAQFVELRRELNNYVDRVSEQEQKFINLNCDLENLKSKYHLLQRQFDAKQRSFMQVNEEVFKLDLKNKQLQNDSQNKDRIINRQKNQIDSFKSQIEQLNDIISAKSQEINKINSKLFEKNINQQNQTYQQTLLLTNQISTLKFTIKNLQNQIQDKQSAFSILTTQINSKNQQIDRNREEIQKIKEQIIKMKRFINDVKRELADEKFSNSQLQSQLSFLKKSQAEEKKKYQQQIQSQSDQIQVLLNKLRQSSTFNSKQQYNLQYFKEGLKMYERQVERLSKIVSDLEGQVTQLKFKITQNFNEQNIAQQQLMTMALTFAEVEALRNNMINKQKQIAQIRKNLLQTARWKGEQSSYNTSYIQGVIEQEKNERTKLDYLAIQVESQLKERDNRQSRQFPKQAGTISIIQERSLKNQDNLGQDIEKIRSKSMNKAENLYFMQLHDTRFGNTNRSESTQGYGSRNLSNSQRLMGFQPNRTQPYLIPQTSSPYQSMKTSVSQAYLQPQFQHYKMMNPTPITYRQQSQRRQQHQHGQFQIKFNH